MEQNKNCTSCNQVKAITEFPYRKDKQIYRNVCKTCVKQYWKNYRIDTPNENVLCEASNKNISKNHCSDHYKTKKHRDNCTSKLKPEPIIDQIANADIKSVKPPRYTYFTDEPIVSDIDTNSSSVSCSSLDYNPESLTYIDPNEIICDICNIYLQN